MITVQEPTIQVCVSETRITVVLHLNEPAPVDNPPAWYEALPYYEDDVEARANGLVTGQIYKVKTTGGILSAKRGTIVEVEDE